MKHIALILLLTCAALFAQDNRKFHLTFCASYRGMDYCHEHEAVVKFEYTDGHIKVTRWGGLVYDLVLLGKWKTDPVTGDSSISVRYDNAVWTLTSREKSYVLDNHHCATIEFWHGSFAEQRKYHGYVQTDLDDMFEFGDRCNDEAYHPRSKKNFKANKFNGDILKVGMAR